MHWVLFFVEHDIHSQLFFCVFLVGHLFLNFKRIFKFLKMNISTSVFFFFLNKNTISDKLKRKILVAEVSSTVSFSSSLRDRKSSSRVIAIRIGAR